MIGQSGTHIRIIDEYRFSFFNMHSSGETVVRIEKAGIDTYDDISSFSSSSDTSLWQCFAKNFTIIRVVVTIRIRADLICHDCFERHFRIVHINLDSIDILIEIGERIVFVYDTRCQFAVFGHLPVIVCFILIREVISFFGESSVADGIAVSGNRSIFRIVLVNTVISDFASDVAVCDIVCASFCTAIATSPSGSMFVGSVCGCIRQNDSVVCTWLNKSGVVSDESACTTSILRVDVSVVNTILEVFICVDSPCKSSDTFHIISFGVWGKYIVHVILNKSFVSAVFNRSFL